MRVLILEKCSSITLVIINSHSNDCECYVIVLLICCSLKTNDVGYLFIDYWTFVYFLWGNVYHSLFHYSFWLSFCCWVLEFLYIFKILKLYHQLVTQSCLTLCDPMNRSTPGLPVHHQLLEFTQTHVHQVRDAIQPSHPLSYPSSPAPNPSQHQSLFQWVNSLHEVAKVLEFQL